VPCETRLHEREAHIVAVYHHSGNEPAVLVNVSNIDGYNLPDQQSGGELLCTLTVILAILRAIDAVKTYLGGCTILDHGDSVTVRYTDDLASEATCSVHRHCEAGCENCRQKPRIPSAT
jgi:hypothetical protein